MQFLLTQAPVGRWEFRPTTQISTRRKFYTSQQVRVPPYWGPGPTPLVKGRWPKARGDREGEYEREALILSRPRWRFYQSIVTPSEAGSPGKGGTRERAQFSPPGGNGDKRTQGELARRAKRRWPGPLRRRAAMGKVGRRPQAAKISWYIETSY